MTKKLKVGDTVRGYRITKVFGPGLMALSYLAETPDRRRVFFKQYKSPSPAVIWYASFVAYQKELSRRVRAGKASNFAVSQIDAFEEQWGGRCYFQAYEFVENGDDLQKIIDEETAVHRATGKPPSDEPHIWTRHVTWAKVLTSGLGSLHSSNIAHADLKPPNVYLIRDPTITSGYQLKLIDMDFSVLTDARAPWHGHQGYIGSDNYRSPEHITKGAVPGKASDMFTCGLILYEILAGRHPYWSDDQAAYAKRVMAYATEPPKLSGHMPPPASGSDVAHALYRCLSPDLEARPTAIELRDILVGKSPSADKLLKTSVVKPTAGSPKPLTTDALELRHESGGSLMIRIRTELSKTLLKRLGPDSVFWDENQCFIERNPRGEWIVTPNEKTTNETLLNGKTISTPVVLSEGDTIAVGREATGAIKMPLSVRGR